MKYKIIATDEKGNEKTFETDGIENTLDSIRKWMWSKTMPVCKHCGEPYINHEDRWLGHVFELLK
jgi:hypothetical protein